MKGIYLFITLSVVFLVFYSCKSSKKNSTNLSENEEQEMVFLNAGSCFGKCKVYQLTILKSGKVEFIAIKNFERLGKSTFELSQDKLKEISLLFEKERFLKLGNEYLSGAKDLQIFEITFMKNLQSFIR